MTKVRPKTRRFLMDSLYGLINGVMVIPIAISFTSIIFRDKIFQPILPILVKLVLFSSLVHQFSFSFISSIPFAIGQVQDAGLIFLSAMNGSIISNLGSSDKDFIISTCLFTLAISTFSLGIILVLIGRFKLASLVQYMPMPVIGGYLAFIGFFCFEAGLVMMSGIEIKSFDDWIVLFGNRNNVLLVLPGILSGICMVILLPIIRFPLFLPICLLLMVSVFYLILFITHTSLEDVRATGWVAPLTSPALFYTIWSYYSPHAVDWSQLIAQSYRWMAMVIVVAFSSSLDVAAIEMETATTMDYNKELQTVGWSNIFSGLSGGFTGSYIFTQTIFTMRRGVNTRICGLITALTELIVVLLPVPITCYIPKFVFGSLLVFIASDLIYEWLIRSYLKMTHLEYAVCIGTFVCMVLYGVQAGLGLGILMAIVMFVITYASTPTVVVSSLNQSHVVRSYQQRKVLIDHHGAIVRVRPQGYVFFGTAVRLLHEMKQHLISTPTQQPSTWKEFSSTDRLGKDTLILTNERSPLYPSNETVMRNNHSTNVTYNSTKDVSNKGVELRSLPHNASLQNSNLGEPVLQSIPHILSDTTVGTTASAMNPSPNGNSTPKQVEYVVFDFSQVIGIDATSARNCFLLLTKLLKSLRIVVEMSESIERLLRVHKVIDDSSHHHCHDHPHMSPDSVTYNKLHEGHGVSAQSDDGDEEWDEESPHHEDRHQDQDRDELRDMMISNTVVIPSIDDALEWCEDCVLYRYNMEKLQVIIEKGSHLPSVSHHKDASDYLLSYKLRQLQQHIKRQISVTKNQIVRQLSRDSSYDNVNLTTSSNNGIIPSYQQNHHLNIEDSYPQDSEEWSHLCDILSEYYEPDNLRMSSKGPTNGDQNHSGLLLSDNIFKTYIDVLPLYFQKTTYIPGSIIYDIGDMANEIYIISHGSVEIITYNTVSVSVSAENQLIMTHQPSQYGSTSLFSSIGRFFSSPSSSSGSSSASSSHLEKKPDRAVERVNKLSEGAICGECEFFLQKPYSMRCYAINTVVMWSLRKKKYDMMRIQYPELYQAIQHVLLRSLSITQISNTHHMYPSPNYHILFQTTVPSVTDSTTGSHMYPSLSSSSSSLVQSPLITRLDGRSTSGRKLLSQDETPRNNRFLG